MFKQKHIREAFIRMSKDEDLKRRLDQEIKRLLDGDFREEDKLKLIVIDGNGNRREVSY